MELKDVVLWRGMGCLLSPLFTYMHGYEQGRKSWDFLNKRYKDALERAKFKIAQLCDGRGGICERCRGFGVTGSGGQSDCWDCGGIGLRSLHEYHFEADAKLAKGEREAELYIEKVKEVRRSLQGHEA